MWAQFESIAWGAGLDQWRREKLKHAKTREEAAAKPEVNSQERGITTWMMLSCKNEEAFG